MSTWSETNPPPRGAQVDVAPGALNRWGERSRAAGWRGATVITGDVGEGIAHIRSAEGSLMGNPRIQDLEPVGPDRLDKSSYDTEVLWRALAMASADASLDPRAAMESYLRMADKAVTKERNERG